MELVEGMSLRDFLAEKGPFEVDAFLDIAIPLAETLGFIHQRNIIHGDIKPSNIMLLKQNGNYKIKILDFGVSLLLLNLDKMGMEAVGTFSYMSPEQSGILKRPVEVRSDLYSLGIVYYQCLVGELPYKAGNVYSLIQKHIAADVPAVHEIRRDIRPSWARSSAS